MSEATGNSDTQPSQPPVIEVALGVYFSPLRGFQVQHIGRFWSDIESQFPTCEQQARHLPPPPGNQRQPSQDQAVSDVPRVWFRSQGRGRLLQLQRDALFLNWNEAECEEVYPGFAQLHSEFMGHLEEFRRFADANGLGQVAPLSCELTYIDIFPQGEEESGMETVKRCLPRMGWQLNGLPQSVGDLWAVNWRAEFKMPAGDDLVSVWLASAAREHSQGAREHVLRLETSAKGAPPEPDSEAVSRWFCAFHDAVGDVFSFFVAEKERVGQPRRER